MNFRDIELLSSYLDGQLGSSESKRLESRLSSDPELRTAMDDLREARGLLRRLPARKAPRNFTLTRKMVGLKPPLPRAYSTFRFATALATLLLFVTFAINAVIPTLTFGAAAPLYQAQEGPCQGCGGGAPESEALEAPAPAEAPTEAPATEAPAAEAPAATEPAAAPPSLAVQGTPTPEPSPAADTMRAEETPLPKVEPTQIVGLTQIESQSPTVVPLIWQIGLGIIAAASALIAFLVRRSASQKWK